MRVRDGGMSGGWMHGAPGDTTLDEDSVSDIATGCSQCGSTAARVGGRRLVCRNGPGRGHPPYTKLVEVEACDEEGCDWRRWRYALEIRDEDVAE